jgi:hypothetical protein
VHSRVIKHTAPGTTAVRTTQHLAALCGTSSEVKASGHYAHFLLSHNFIYYVRVYETALDITTGHLKVLTDRRMWWA